MALEVTNQSNYTEQIETSQPGWVKFNTDTTSCSSLHPFIPLVKNNQNNWQMDVHPRGYQNVPRHIMNSAAFSTEENERSGWSEDKGTNLERPPGLGHFEHVGPSLLTGQRKRSSLDWFVVKIYWEPCPRYSVLAIVPFIQFWESLWPACVLHTPRTFHFNMSSQRMLDSTTSYAGIIRGRFPVIPLLSVKSIITMTVGKEHEA